MKNVVVKLSKVRLHWRYDGLASGPSNLWGGDLVSSVRDKFRDGAITIANLNDTNGDEIIDKDQLNIIHSAKGYDELDLMKLEIIPSGKIPPGCTVKLVTSGKIKFYETPIKVNPPITNLDFPLIDSQNNLLMRTLYVEAYEVSTNIKDIVIEAYVGSNKMDAVKATAIWVRKKKIYSDSISRINLPDPNNLPLNNSNLLTSIDKTPNNHPYGYRSKNGTRYGFGTMRETKALPYFSNEDNALGVSILFEFEIFPHDIVRKLKTYNITFDIGRRAEYEVGKNYHQDGGLTRRIDSPHFPLSIKLDAVNDDPDPDGNGPLNANNLDESLVPKSGHYSIFSWDVPSTWIRYEAPPLGIGPIFDTQVRNINFKEFVRVSFKNGNSLMGNSSNALGSRCSDQVDWKLSSSTYKAKNSSNKNKVEYMVGEEDIGYITTAPTYLPPIGNPSLNPSFGALVAYHKSDHKALYTAIVRKDNYNNNLFLEFTRADARPHPDTNIKPPIGCLGNCGNINTSGLQYNDQYINVDFTQGNVNLGDEFYFIVDEIISDNKLTYKP